MWETVSPVLQDFVVTLLGGVLALLSAFLIAIAKKGFDWLQAKIENTKNEETRAAIKMAVENLEKTVCNVVVSLQQTLGDLIKDSIENNTGEYTKEDLLALKEEAYKKVTAQLSEATLTILNQAYDDLADHIYDLIEQNVRLLKEQFIAQSRLEAF